MKQTVLSKTTTYQITRQYNHNATTVDSRYLQVLGILWNTSRYPYLDIPVSDLQYRWKYKSNNHISQKNM